MPLVESTSAFPREEVLSSVRTKLTELHLSTLRPIFQSLSHSDSPRLSELPLPDVPSHSACSIIGRSSRPIHLRRDPRLTPSALLSERERVLRRLFQPSITSSINCEDPQLPIIASNSDLLTLPVKN